MASCMASLMRSAYMMTRPSTLRAARPIVWIRDVVLLRFMETHVNPKVAKSDAANAIKFSEVEKLWKTLLAIHKVVKGA